MQKLTGLWKNTSKNGTTYYSGKVGNTKFLIFKNDKGDNERAPDLQLSIAKVDDDVDWTRIPQADDSAPQPLPSGKPVVKGDGTFDDLDSEIPF